MADVPEIETITEEQYAEFAAEAEKDLPKRREVMSLMLNDEPDPRFEVWAQNFCGGAE